MEFALPELLSREDILKILDQRQLHVRSMNELTHDELLKVYKTFVMPLSKRPERSKKIKQNFYNKLSNINADYEKHHMQVETFDDSVNSMDIDFPCMETCNVGQLSNSDRMASPVGEKRRQRSREEDILDMCENDYQYQLSSVTKRIRINSLA